MTKNKNRITWLGVPALAAPVEHGLRQLAAHVSPDLLRRLRLLRQQHRPSRGQLNYFRKSDKIAVLTQTRPFCKN
jgi:hypothetical protein